MSHLLVVGLLFVLDNSIVEASLTASGRKGHHGQLVPVHGPLAFLLHIERFLVSLGTPSHQRLELRTLPGRIIIMLGGLVGADLVVVLYLAESIHRAEFASITVLLILFV